MFTHTFSKSLYFTLSLVLALLLLMQPSYSEAQTPDATISHVTIDSVAIHIYGTGLDQH